MAAEWIVDDELSRLHREWICAARAYARHRSEDSLNRVLAASDAYTQRAAQLCRRTPG